jgi:hypothetical protein
MNADRVWLSESNDYDVESYGDEKHYVIADAVDALAEIDDADLICLDDAWARPLRAKQFGVTYPTHRFSKEETQKADDLSTTTVDILEACKDALNEGGWLIADADAWLLPRLLQYFLESESWGDVVEDYVGGGYRRTGFVTYIARSTGEPHRGTAGQYMSNGGYPVVFAHKGKTERRTTVSAAQMAYKPTENYGWGSVKPIHPYTKWIGGLLEPEEDDHLVVPCAGTAPAAIGAELAFGGGLRCTCIDSESGARDAFKERLEDALDPTVQLLDVAPPQVTLADEFG